MEEGVHTRLCYSWQNLAGLVRVCSILRSEIAFEVYLSSALVDAGWVRASAANTPIAQSTGSQGLPLEGASQHRRS